VNYLGNHMPTMFSDVLSSSLMLCQKKKKKEQNGLHVKTTTYVTNFHYRMMTLIYLHTSVQEKNYTTPFLRKRELFLLKYRIK